SVNTTGYQLYPLPSVRRRPMAGKFICGPAINTSSRASLVSNWCRVAAAAVWSMSNTAVTSGRCSWTRSAWTMSPQNRILFLRREFIAGMSRGMTRQGHEFHAVDDFLGATKPVPPTGLDVRRCDRLRTLEEWLCILRRLGSDVLRQPKVAVGLRDVHIGMGENALAVLSGQTTDVIGMEVRDQHDV